MLPLDELARRFDLSKVAHSAGVFDEDKLAWVNRHYLKAADPARLVDLSLPFLRERSIVVDDPSAAAREWLLFTIPAMAASIDRLSQVPDRLAQIFDALPVDQINSALAAEERTVIRAFARTSPVRRRLLDRDRWRAAADRVKARTGQKGPGALSSDSGGDYGQGRRS